MTTPHPDHQPELEAFGIANALIKARTELGMTQAQLAEDSGISRSTIKAYESGRNMPGSRELKAICRVLKVSPNMLLFGSESPFSEPSGPPGSEAGLRLLLSDGEDRKKARARIAMLSELLAPDEVESLLNLVQALANARHGAEIVREKILAADMLAGIQLSMEKAMAKSITEGKAPPAEETAAAFEDFMLRQGHGKKPPEPQ